MKATSEPALLARQSCCIWAFSTRQVEAAGVELDTVFGIGLIFEILRKNERLK
jgi:hypothetical protein